MSEEDDSEEVKPQESEEDGELTLAEKRERSEKISRKAFKGTKEVIHSAPGKRKGPGGIKGKKRVKFEDLLKAHIAGATEEQLAKQFDLGIDTIKMKIPALELVRVNLGIPKSPSMGGK